MKHFKRRILFQKRRIFSKRRILLKPLMAIPCRSSHYYKTWSSYYTGYADFKNGDIFLLRPTILALARNNDLRLLRFDHRMSRSRLLWITAAPVNILITTYMEKRKTVLWFKLTFFGIILPHLVHRLISFFLSSLFFLVTRINLW